MEINGIATVVISWDDKRLILCNPPRSTVHGERGAPLGKPGDAANIHDGAIASRHHTGGHRTAAENAGQEVPVPPKKVAVFKPGLIMKQRVK